MTIPVRESELVQVGLPRGMFPNLRINERRLWAIRALLSRGRNYEATLLEINNVIAVSGITYLNDMISPIGQR
jgi:hypothetical protein